jgi:hypothetical protein
LIAGGSFNSVFRKSGAQGANNMAQWSEGEGSRMAGGAGDGSSNLVYALGVYNGQLAVGGYFQVVDWKGSSCWGLWEPKGPFSAPDFNHNCYVDADDRDMFLPCITGPSIPYAANGVPAGCTLGFDAGGYLDGDFDQDGDLDQTDFGVFQRCYRGLGVAADPSCTD